MSNNILFKEMMLGEINTRFLVAILEMNNDQINCFQHIRNGLYAQIFPINKNNFRCMSSQYIPKISLHIDASIIIGSVAETP